MQNTAENIDPQKQMAVGAPRPVEVSEHTDARTMAVELFRDLANRLESGELYGARVEWREGLAFVVRVETSNVTDETALITRATKGG